MKILAFLMTMIGFTQAAMSSELVSMRDGVRDSNILLTSSAPLVEADPNTYYGKTAAWFDQGLAMYWLDVRGFHAGRCFSFDDQDIAYNSFLGYVSRGAGPGFNDLPLVVDAVYMPDGKPDHFDNMASYDQMVAETEKVLSGRKQHYGPVSEDPTLNIYFDMEPNNRKDTLIEYRFHENMIVKKATNLITQNMKTGIMKSKRLVQAGQVLTYCYYFRRVAD